MLRIAQHAPQYLDLSRLLFRHGGAELATAIGLGGGGDQDASECIEGGCSPDELVRDIEKLGPAYIKLAQIASTREDLISPEYIKALERLQDDVEPFDAETLRATFEEELGVSPSRVFSSFEETPTACGSLGQVHRATMRDGRQVVVKVQRPDVDAEAHKQLAALHELAKVADERSEIGRKFRFCSLVQAVEYAINLELDFRTEAAHLQKLGENLSEFENIRIPQPLPDLVSKRVLVMEELSGVPLRDISGVVLNEVNTEELAHTIIRAYLKQILIDGFFHADPHPGNLFFTSDHKLGLIDGGMVVAVSTKLRQKFAQLLMAISDQEGEEAARVAIEIGQQEDDFDADAFEPAAARIIAQGNETHEKAISPGRMAVELLNVAGEHGLILPFEIILFAKSLIQMENTVYRLAPQMDLRQIVRRYSTRLLVDRAGETMNWGNVARTALQSAELASSLPQRLNRITEMLAENSLRIQVDAIDERELLAGVHKIANRITAGLVTSALIIGASLLLRADIGPHLLGMPILATFFFVVAALIGLYLVYVALVKDR